jgi:hypothetical protein
MQMKKSSQWRAFFFMEAQRHNDDGHIRYLWKRGSLWQ